jgi:RNA recognition motif-containing protein
MEVKLYVGNMPYSTTEDQLRTMFAEAGTVVDVAIIKDRDSGTPKGFAFVTMGSQDDATKAITMFNGKDVGGRALTVNPARPREERPGGGRGFVGGGGGGGYRSDRGNDRGGYNRR